MSCCHVLCKASSKTSHTAEWKGPKQRPWEAGRRTSTSSPFSTHPIPGSQLSNAGGKRRGLEEQSRDPPVHLAAVERLCVEDHRRRVPGLGTVDADFASELHPGDGEDGACVGTRQGEHVILPVLQQPQHASGETGGSETRGHGHPGRDGLPPHSAATAATRARHCARDWDPFTVDRNRTGPCAQGEEKAGC